MAATGGSSGRASAGRAADSSAQGGAAAPGGGGFIATGGSEQNIPTSGTSPTLPGDGGSSGSDGASSTGGVSATAGEFGTSIGGAIDEPGSTGGAAGTTSANGGVTFSDGGVASAGEPGNAGQGGSAEAEPGTCTPASRVRKELLQDGRFEPSASAWNLTNTDLAITGDAHTTPNFVRLAGFSSPDAYTGVSQTVTFPPEAADIKLSFYIRIESANGDADDILYFGWNEPDSDAVEAFQVPNEMIPDWQPVSHDVPATVAGKTMLFIIAAQNGSTSGGYWTYWVDTVSVTALVCP